MPSMRRPTRGKASNKHRRWIEASAFTILATFATASSAAAADTPAKMTYAFAHQVVGVGEEVYMYFVPKQLGYFAAEGIDVTMQPGGNISLAAQGLQSNSFQVAETTPSVILKLREQGGDLVAFNQMRADPGSPIAVLPDSPIKKIDDLKGHTVASTQWAGQGALALMVSLQQDGIGLDDYTRVTAPAGPPSSVALTGGRVDALALWDAVYGAMENTGLKLRYIDLPLARLLSGLSLTTTQRFASSQPKALAGFCRAINKALYFSHVNTTAAISILLDGAPSLVPAGAERDKILKDDVHIFDAYLGNTLLGVPEGGKTGAIQSDVWDYISDYYTKTGELKGSVPTAQGYTNTLTDACNDFDRAPIKAAALAYGK
jgi:NitT/TauT family transport system substrate-binding protein